MGGRGQFSRGHFSEGGLCKLQIIQKAIFLGSNLQGMLSGGNYFGGNFLGAIIQVAIIRGGNFPREQLSSGPIVSVAGIQWVIFQGVIIRWAVFLGDICPRALPGPAVAWGLIASRGMKLLARTVGNPPQSILGRGDLRSGVRIGQLEKV